MMPEYENMTLIEKKAVWIEKYKKWKLEADEILILSDIPEKDNVFLHKILNKIQKLKNSAEILKTELDEINREEREQKKLV